MDIVGRGFLVEPGALLGDRGGLGDGELLEDLVWHTSDPGEEVLVDRPCFEPGHHRFWGLRARDSAKSLVSLELEWLC